MFSANEKTVLLLAFMACSFGLCIVFMNDNKASLYIAIPAAFGGAAATYLGTNRE